MSNSNLISFGNTLAESVSSTMSQCEKFGMAFGCRPDCPVFENQECEIQEENTESFAEVEK